MADVVSAPEIHYEVHVLRGDRWMIDMTTRERTEAVEDAEGILRRQRVGGVRVLQERFNPRTDTVAGRVILEKIMPKPDRRKIAGPAARPRIERRRVEGVDAPVRRAPAAAAPPPEQRGTPLVGYILGVAVLAAAVGLLAWALM